MVKSALICLMIAMDLPKWIIKEIGKITHELLWEGREQRMGVILWFLGRVCLLIQYGGLGIHDVQTIGWALTSWLL